MLTIRTVFERGVAAQGPSDPVMRAVEIAAAGGHHVLLDAAEPTGSLLVAQWLHGLLPAVKSTPPMVTTHFSRSQVAVIGGSRPGDVSRAHGGLLVACDLDEFSNGTLEGLAFVLRQGKVSLAVGREELEYPAGFQLFATRGRGHHRRVPRMPLHLLDEFGIRLQLAATESVIGSHTGADRWGVVWAEGRARVAAARERARARERSAAGWASAGESSGCAALVLQRVRTGTLSERGAEQVIRVAWTAADLDGAAVPTSEHFDEALELRRVGGRRG